jgi:carboxylesterase type B
MGKATKSPVFVAIHGGSFLQGMSSSLKPAYMLENDVVLVVPQYRLGPLGELIVQYVRTIRHHIMLGW